MKKQFCGYRLNLPVTKFIRDDIKPLQDAFPTPEQIGDWPHGEKRVWGIQYAKSEKLLTDEYLNVLRNDLGINDCHNMLGKDVHGEDGGYGTVAWFRGEPNTHMHIHVDGGTSWAINVSWGTTKDYMVWWEPKPGEFPHGRTSITGRTAPAWWEHQCNEVDRVQVLGPYASIVKTNIPHSAENHGDTLRWACSVRDQTSKMSFEEAVEHFSKWIVPRTE